MTAQEVEIKVRVANPDGFRGRLTALGLRLATPRTHESNTLYDLPGLPLRSRGELLRLRRYGERWTLTHKGPGTPGRHKSRAETETEVADGEAVARILEALGFLPVFRYEKFRSEWSGGAGHVVLDETPIGNFAEIEGPAAWIDETAAKLGVEPAEYITASYAQLFQEWKRRTGSTAEEMTFAAAGGS